MALLAPAQPIQTVADLVDQLGGIPLSRIRFRPAPGTATEADLLEVERRDERLCELVDGTLVEKAMGYRESLLAGALLSLLRNFVSPRNLGLVSGADGMMRLFPGLVRIPDVAFVAWRRIPGGRVPQDAIPDLVPDLAVEVLSKSNTPGEMTRKLGEYFEARVRLVWLVDPDDRTVRVHSRSDDSTLLEVGDSLDGGDVLPGFTAPLAALFAELDRSRDG